MVTGGGRGIGAAIARRLAADGHDLVIGYRGDRASAEAVAAEVRAAGREATVAQVDVTDVASVEAFFAVAEAAGPVTALVSNAAEATAVGRLEDLDLAAVRHDLDVDLFGVIACAKYGVLAIRRAGGGAIVNISSGAASTGGADTYVHYAAAKAGVDGFTLGLARELARDGIRVNAVAPGLIRTTFHQDPDRPQKLAATVPMGRPGEPEEIAGAVAWLLSADASYTTGAVLRVAGGR